MTTRSGRVFGPEESPETENDTTNTLLENTPQPHLQQPQPQVQSQDMVTQILTTVRTEIQNDLNARLREFAGDLLRELRGDLEWYTRVRGTEPEPVNDVRGAEPEPVNEHNQQRQQHGHIKPGRYNSGSHWGSYLTKFERVSKMNGWGCEEQAVQLMAALDDAALTVVTNLHNPSFQEMVDALEDRYGSKGQEHLYMHRLRGRKQGPNEDLTAFAAELEMLARQALPPNSSAALADVMALQQFYDGIRSVELRKLVLNFPTTSLKGALSYALHADANLRRAIGNTQHATVQAIDEEPKVRAVSREQLSRSCWRCNYTGHPPRYCPTVQCWTCRKTGHTSYDCPNQQRFPTGNGEQS